jgi:hypothetical protein
MGTFQCKSPKSNLIEIHSLISMAKREGGQDDLPYMLQPLRTKIAQHIHLKSSLDLLVGGLTQLPY